MLTLEKVKEMFEWANQEPGRWVATIQTIIVDIYEGVAELSKEHGKTRGGAVKAYTLAKAHQEVFDQLKAARGGGAPPAPNGDATPETVLGPDGKPLSPEQIEFQKRTAAAIGGQAQPQRRPAPPPVGPGGEVRVGADGVTPLTPEQAEAEDVMDAAINAGT